MSFRAQISFGPEDGSRIDFRLKMSPINQTKTRTPVIDASVTLRVAELSRLELSSDEVAVFTQQMATVLAHVDQLAEVNVDGVEPLFHPFDGETPMREDVVESFPLDSKTDAPKVLSAATDVLYDGYRVPQIL